MFGEEFVFVFGGMIEGGVVFPLLFLLDFCLVFQLKSAEEYQAIWRVLVVC